MRTTYLISCLIALLAFSSCSVEEEEQTFDLSQKLVAHYAFDGNTKDASNFNVTATTSGVKLTHDRYANPNHAFYFDGIDDKILIPASDHINFTTEFTINVWIKTDANHLQQVLFKNVSDDKEIKAAYGISLGHTPKDEIQKATNDIIFSIAPFGIEQELRKFDYEKETWYMVTCILKDDTMYLYINGKPAVLKYINGELSTSALPLILGSDPTAKNPFQGSIDDLRMYSDAKSLDFIEYLYKQ
ncbi:LamG domain-containing protein [uncultured Kordia sp.]|uniref:LamG domain-containing protein n=1 Tax=uncultured Kordia sp. TaxID=507699 RepID=UPI00262F722D|nr:LamG domain-containing protein [uncultured Kordia sp.]